MIRIFRNWFQQEGKIEWAIMITALLFIVLTFLQQMFGGFWYSTIVRTIRTSSWILAVFMSFVFGLRGVRLNGFKGKTKHYLLIGTTLSIFVIGFNITILIVVPKTMDMLRGSDEDITQLETILNDPDLDSEGKAFISSSIASQKYRNSGELVDVFQKDGSISAYIPTEADIYILESRTYLKNRINEIMKSTVIFVFVLIFSILIGILIPVDRKATIPGTVE
jgi:hypothetical protein